MPAVEAFKESLPGAGRSDTERRSHRIDRDSGSRASARGRWSAAAKPSSAMSRRALAFELPEFGLEPGQAIWASVPGRTGCSP